MTTFVALLRGINVGGRNRMSMDALRELVTSLGYEDVGTYVQSGNVVFSGTGSPSEAARAIESGIADVLGLDVAVMVRSAPQLARILRDNPYAGLGADPKTVHVTFLAEPPDDRHRRELEEVAAGSGPDGLFGDDRFALLGADVFLFCPGGYGRTKLNNAFFERRAGGEATTRNWRTVTTLAGKAGLEVADT
jgi:uncharacterized protein (DUF1697 family)